MSHPFTIMSVLFTLLFISWFWLVAKAVANRPQAIPLKAEAQVPAKSPADQTF